MTQPLIPGFVGLRGAQRHEVRPRETQNATPQAEPNGAIESRAPKAAFDTHLQRARSEHQEAPTAQSSTSAAAQEGDDRADAAPAEQGVSAEQTEGEQAQGEGAAIVAAPATAPATPVAPAALATPAPELPLAQPKDSPPRQTPTSGAASPSAPTHESGAAIEQSGQPGHEQAEGRQDPRPPYPTPVSERGETTGIKAESTPLQAGEARPDAGADQARSPRVAHQPLSELMPEVEQPSEAAESGRPRAADAPQRSPDTVIRHEGALRIEAEPAAPRVMQGAPLGKPVSGEPARAAQTEDLSEAPKVVARGLSAAVAQRGGVVHVRLVPETLGEVRIQMNLDALSVSVRIEASTASAQGLLNEHLSILRSSLESRGLTVDRLAVHLAPPPTPASQPSSNGADLGQSMGQRQDHDAGGSPSRGRSDDDAAHGSAAGEPPEEATERNDAAARPVFASRLSVRLSAVA